MAKTRLDILILERGLVESRSLAQRLVMAGRVRVNGEIVLKPSTLVSNDSLVQIDQPTRFVSRGGEKLEAALQAFPIEIEGKVCADVGSSTGGFTDCLLQYGAQRVYAIDVGKGILHWKLRQDYRVHVLEETNARYLEILPEPVSVVAIDASFISLKVLVPVIKNWFLVRELEESGQIAHIKIADPTIPTNISGPPNHLIALIKPQFEAGRQIAARGAGVIRDPEQHRKILHDVLDFCQAEKFTVRGLIRSPLLGPKGNAEFLAWFTYPQAYINLSVDEIISQVIV